MAKIDITKIDDDKLQEKFEEAFRAKADDRNYELKISDFEAEVERDPSRNVRMKVTIYGLAEVTTINQFQDPRTKTIVKGGEALAFDIDGRGTAEFIFDGTAEKNSSDYVVYYKTV